MSGIVFLDRDGVINKYPGNFKYVESQKDFIFLPRAKEAIGLLTEAGYKILVISNQAGVSKGIYSKEALDEITKNMLKEIEKFGGRIEKVLYCIHTEEENCNCRKPKIGLITQALKELNSADKKKSFLVGDSIRDIMTGRNASLKTILVLSGREKIENKGNWEIQPDFVAQNLYNAAEIMISQDKQK